MSTYEKVDNYAYHEYEQNDNRSHPVQNYQTYHNHSPSNLQNQSSHYETSNTITTTTNTTSESVPALPLTDLRANLPNSYQSSNSSALEPTSSSFVLSNHISPQLPASSTTIYEGVAGQFLHLALDFDHTAIDAERDIFIVHFGHHQQVRADLLPSAYETSSGRTLRVEVPELGNNILTMALLVEVQHQDITIEHKTVGVFRYDKGNQSNQAYQAYHSAGKRKLSDYSEESNVQNRAPQKRVVHHVSQRLRNAPDGLVELHPPPNNLMMNDFRTFYSNRSAYNSNSSNSTNGNINNGNHQINGDINTHSHNPANTTRYYDENVNKSAAYVYPPMATESSNGQYAQSKARSPPTVSALSSSMPPSASVPLHLPSLHSYPNSTPQHTIPPFVSSIPPQPTSLSASAAATTIQTPSKSSTRQTRSKTPRIANLIPKMQNRNAPIAPAPPALIRTSMANRQIVSSSTSDLPPNFNPYTMFPGSKAKLEISGDLMSMTKDWTTEERSVHRRLVEFERRQVGNTIETSFKAVLPNERSPTSPCISCIWWARKKQYYCTSVDTIMLLEFLVNVVFTVEEKNRIRRNLEGFKPYTVSKTKAECEDIFKLVMGFPIPKPRNIEKDIKVFYWSNLKDALKKIIGKYSASYAPTTATLISGTPITASYIASALTDLTSLPHPALANSLVPSFPDLTTSHAMMMNNNITGSSTEAQQHQQQQQQQQDHNPQHYNLASLPHEGYYPPNSYPITTNTRQPTAYHAQQASLHDNTNRPTAHQPQHHHNNSWSNSYMAVSHPHLSHVRNSSDASPSAIDNHSIGSNKMGPPPRPAPSAASTSTSYGHSTSHAGHQSQSQNQLHQHQHQPLSDTHHPESLQQLHSSSNLDYHQNGQRSYQPASHSQR